MEVFWKFWKLFSFCSQNTPQRKLSMIIRKSFFIRWLLFTGDDREQERSVIEIKHIQSGCSRRVSTLEEAKQWMNEAKNDERKEDRHIEGE